MIKFRNIGAYKTARNIGYCVTPTGVTLKNGMGVTADLAGEVVALPTSNTTKGDVYLVLNVIDKPETLAPNDYQILAGEYPRLFNVKSLEGQILDCDLDSVTGALSTFAVGDTLAFGTDGKMVEVADVTAYLTYFKVIDKTTFGGGGLGLQVCVNDKSSLILQAQDAPTGLAGVAPTTVADDDGKITGTTSAMEYKLAAGETYTACGGNEVTGLAAGSYVVRLAAKTGYNASATAAVTVPAFGE